MTLKSLANCCRERYVFLQGFSHFVPIKRYPGTHSRAKKLVSQPQGRENNVPGSACANNFFNHLLTIVETGATSSPLEFMNMVKKQGRDFFSRLRSSPAMLGAKTRCAFAGAGIFMLPLYRMTLLNDCYVAFRPERNMTFDRKP
ncbi:hypothetical protein [Labrys miyagiensis]|uniref:hypothetical protein n=1 Tax=Labrys miyagiensis TaxID=346912 RepID=UPI0024E19451|nr:hypothetical protein [Labrys miyagiensis]